MMDKYDQARFDRALEFATLAHGEQKSKYLDVPYVRHCERVARRLIPISSTTMEMLEAALLHDVVEDTPVGLDEIKIQFGEIVGGYVDLLTDPPLAFGNRAKRKARVAERMLTAPWQVKTIKLSDLIDNIGSIVEHDTDFARVFLREKDFLLDHLLGGNQELWNEARSLCDSGLRKLGETE